jgi:hypothetical protein
VIWRWRGEELPHAAFYLLVVFHVPSKQLGHGQNVGRVRNWSPKTHVLPHFPEESMSGVFGGELEFAEAISFT